jgi:transposase InsO family protein
MNFPKPVSKSSQSANQGLEFVAKAVRVWIAAVGAKAAYIERGSPWENGYVESFNGKLKGGARGRPDSIHLTGALAHLAGQGFGA